MKFSIRFADQIVGALVILALAILVVVVFMLGRSQRWFVRDYQYKTYFNSASGLSPNMALQYKGFTIGHVKKIMLAADDSVEVLFIVFEEHNHRVKEGSVVELQAGFIPALGNAFVFYPGKGTEIMTEGSTIPEKNSSRARQLIAMGLVDMPEANDSINNIINQVNTLLETLNIALAGSRGADELALGQILGNVEKTTASLNALIQSLSGQLDPILANVGTITGDLSGRLDPILTNVGTISDQIASPSGTVMSLLDAEGPVFSSITEVLESVTGTIKSLEKTIEFVPAQLPQISLLISNLRSTLVEAEKLIVALTNNPLLKGGVPELKETGPGAATPRDLDFYGMGE